MSEINKNQEKTDKLFFSNYIDPIKIQNKNESSFSKSMRELKMKNRYGSTGENSNESSI